MHYSPSSPETYQPLWSWGEGNYLHLAGVRDIILKQHVFHFAHDGLVRWRFGKTAAWAVPACIQDPDAVVARLPLWKGAVLSGPLPWAVGSLLLEITRQKQTTVYTGTLLWNARTGEAVVETLRLLLPKAERSEVLRQLREGILAALPGGQLAGASVLDAPAVSAHGQMQRLPRLALEGGSITPAGSQSLRVATLIGDPVMLFRAEKKEQEPASKTLIATAETLVKDPVCPGWVRLTAVPPQNERDIFVFNGRIAASPVRLLSWEMLRVLQTLKVLRLWYARWPEVVGRSADALEVDVVADRKRAVRYVCLDEFGKCFTPIPHIWRQDADTTWHGQPSAHNMDLRFLARF